MSESTLVDREETVSYLEMRHPSELRPASEPYPVFTVQRAEVPCAELSRFFYTAIGGDWLWTDRIAWSYAQWQAWVQQAGYECWLASVAGTPAGYFELVGPTDGSVELAYFGLLPQFVGQGLGGPFLTRAIQRAWEKQPTRVFVHTSSFDHPNALTNYQARGFRLYRTETTTVRKPSQPIGPWPGSHRRDVPADSAR